MLSMTLGINEQTTTAVGPDRTGKFEVWGMMYLAQVVICESPEGWVKTPLAKYHIFELALSLKDNTSQPSMVGFFVYTIANKHGQPFLSLYTFDSTINHPYPLEGLGCRVFKLGYVVPSIAFESCR